MSKFKPHELREISSIKTDVGDLLELIRNPPENSRVITITPHLAQWILENRNPRNRKRKPARIKRYSAMMELGADGWVLSGDTIKFGRAGNLIDGQNRLAACLLAGKSFRTHVVFGIEDEAFDVIDTGKARTSTDLFHVAGTPHAGLVGPAVRWLMLFGAGTPADRGRTFSNQELWQYYQSRLDADGLAEACERASHVPKGLPRGNLAALFYLFKQRNGATAKKFADDMIKCVRGGRALQKRFADLRKQTMGRLHENQVNALIICSWNCYRAGKIATKRDLNWTDAKEFPSIA